MLCIHAYYKLSIYLRASRLKQYTLALCATRRSDMNLHKHSEHTAHIYRDHIKNKTIKTQSTTKIVLPYDTGIRCSQDFKLHPNILLLKRNHSSSDDNTNKRNTKRISSRCTREERRTGTSGARRRRRTTRTTRRSGASACHTQSGRNGKGRRRRHGGGNGGSGGRDRGYDGGRSGRV